MMQTGIGGAGMALRTARRDGWPVSPMNSTTIAESAGDAPRLRMFATLADNPHYRQFYVGQGISLIGTWLQDAAVSWIVFDLTQSEAMLGLVNAAGIVPAVFVGLIAGALADRVAPKAMIVGMQLAQMALALVLGLLAAAGVVEVWHLAAVLALARVAVTFEMPSRQVFLYELVGRSSLMNAIALNSGLFHASRVIGPALAGLFLAWFGQAPCFLLNGVSFLAAIGALAMIPTPSKLKRRSPSREPGEVFGGLAYLGRDRRVRLLFALMAFFGAVGMGYAAMVPAYARVVVGTGQLGYGLLMASTGLGATLGALVVASLGSLTQKDRLVSLGMFVFGVSLAAAGWIPPAVPQSAAMPAASFCLLGTGFGAIMFFAATQTLIQTAVPDAIRGRIMALWIITYSASVPLGSLWAGLLSSAVGVPRVLEVSAAVCVATAVGVAASGMLEETKEIEEEL